MTAIKQQVPDLHPAVRDAADAINSVYHELDTLRAANIELSNRVVVAEGIAAHLRDELREVTAERDNYMRKSFAFTNTLGSARDLIEGMLTLAEHEAKNPGPKKEIEKPKSAEQLDAGG